MRGAHELAHIDMAMYIHVNQGRHVECALHSILAFARSASLILYPVALSIVTRAPAGFWVHVTAGLVIHGHSCMASA